MKALKKSAIRTIRFFLLMPIFFIFNSTPAMGQVETTTQIVKFCIICPSAQVRIVNATNDGSVLLPEINSDMGPVIGQGGEWGRNLSPIMNGDTPITIRVCDVSTPFVNLDAPPAWALDTTTYGTLAFANPNTLDQVPIKEIGYRVKYLKRATKQRLGGDLRAKELDDWFHRVKAHGIEVASRTCENPTVLAAMALYWNYWGDGRFRVTSVIVRGNRGHYHLDQPRYVY